LRNGKQKQEHSINRAGEDIQERALVRGLREDDLRDAVSPRVPSPSTPINHLRYNPFVPELDNGRHRARRLVKKFNDYFLDDSTPESLQADRVVMLMEIVGKFRERSFIDPPFRADYGCNISMGADVYANFK